jgi:hypothetical protein
MNVRLFACERPSKFGPTLTALAAGSSSCCANRFALSLFYD